MPHYPITKIKTIPYKSPSGTININKYIPPFEKLKTGYGFVGILATDTKTGKLQCHICGKWYEMLTTHIFAKHHINSKQYCIKFNLFRSTALKSIRIRKIHSKTMLGMRKKHKKHRFKFKKNNTQAGNRLGWKKPAENKNKFGICDLQVLKKIKQLKTKLKKTPALTELIDEYGGAFSTLIHTRYGGYLSLLKKLNWKPVTSSYNPKYSRQYFIQKGINALQKGKKLKTKHILTQSEQRHIYKFFPQGWHSWQKTTLKTWNNQHKRQINLQKT